jgi:hypothetical protein
MRSWPVFAANQEIPRILWNPKVLYRTHKCPTPVPILSQLHPVPTTPSNFLNIHLSIIRRVVIQSIKWSSVDTEHEVERSSDTGNYCIKNWYEILMILPWPYLVYYCDIVLGDWTKQRMRLADVEARFELRTSKKQSRIGNGSTKVLVGGMWMCWLS